LNLLFYKLGFCLMVLIFSFACTVFWEITLVSPPPPPQCKDVGYG
jgi:hypothetical protein